MTVKKRCTLSCCVSPKKKITEVQKKRVKARKLKYKLPYTGIGERQTMLVLKNLDHSYSEIGKILNCDKSTVFRQLTKYKDTQNFMDSPKLGRPKKITPEIEKELISLVEEKRTRTSGELVALLQEKFPGLSCFGKRWTVVLRKRNRLVWQHWKELFGKFGMNLLPKFFGSSSKEFPEFSEQSLKRKVATLMRSMHQESLNFRKFINYYAFFTHA